MLNSFKRYDERLKNNCDYYHIKINEPNFGIKNT